MMAIVPILKPTADISEYMKGKIKQEPRLVLLSNENHIMTIADNSNWGKTTTISTDGLQSLSDNFQAQTDIMDVRFQQALDTLFGKGNVV
jgi:hypothetical protein